VSLVGVFLAVVACIVLYLYCLLSVSSFECVSSSSLCSYYYGLRGTAYSMHAECRDRDRHQGSAAAPMFRGVF